MYLWITFYLLSWYWCVFTNKGYLRYCCNLGFEWIFISSLKIFNEVWEKIKYLLLQFIITESQKRVRITYPEGIFVNPNILVSVFTTDTYYIDIFGGIDLQILGDLTFKSLHNPVPRLGTVGSKTFVRWNKKTKEKYFRHA